MKFLLLLPFVVVLAAPIEGYNLEKFKEMINKWKGNKQFSDLFESAVNQHNSDTPVGTRSFFCPILKSPSIPTSVHKLMPGDVKIVAAMGDSITGANGALAHSAIGLLVQYRGVSWSIGGDKTLSDVITLPNILRQYNSDLVGHSTGIGPHTTGSAAFNVAVAGAKSIDMPAQARDLVKRLKDSKDINFRNDWKVITLFIGGNDLCDYCKPSYDGEPEKYVGRIKEALDILHAEVPRAFVNLVSTVNVTMMRELTSGLICKVLNLYECKCASYPESEAAFNKLKAITIKYTAETFKLINTGRYDSKDDFTVVVQPFFNNTAPPRTVVNGKSKIDYSYFSPDCFHFSGKAHAAAALALWNNMVEKIGEKRTEWTLGEPLMCPTSRRPYFFTSKNSA